jgi:tetrahydrodipicolinate N-acetyltransferase
VSQAAVSSKRRRLSLPDTTYGIRPAAVWAVLSRAAWIRSALYSLRFRGPVVVGRGSRIRAHRKARVRLSPGSLLFVGLEHDGGAGTALRLRPGAELVVDGTVQIMRGCRVTVWDGASLSIGTRSFVNDGSTIVCYERIRIGSGCAISWNTTVTDTDVHRLTRDGREQQRTAPVDIADSCWIGTGAIVLKGVTVGTGSVVAAGSVITRPVGPGVLVGGTPARVLDENVSWRH